MSVANIKNIYHVAIEMWSLEEICINWQKRQRPNAYWHLTNDQIIILCLLW